MTNREQNRKLMPNVADVVDTFTKHFGPVKVLYAEDFETGVKRGKEPKHETLPEL